MINASFQMCSNWQDPKLISDHLCVSLNWR